jgi:hypothetical protein
MLLTSPRKFTSQPAVSASLQAEITVVFAALQINANFWRSTFSAEYNTDLFQIELRLYMHAT